MCGPWYVSTAFALFMQHNPFTKVILQVITCCHLFIALLSCIKEMMVTCIMYIIGKFEKKSKEKNRKKVEKIEVMCSPWYIPTAAYDLILFSIFSILF
jgi:hypothetical protein